MRLTALAFALAATSAMAEEPTLTGAEILALLPTVVSTDERSRQTFDVSGVTFYLDRGRPTTGTWWVENDRYCSVWPPSDQPTCYQVAQDGEILIWIGPTGIRTMTTIEPRER